MLTMHAAKPPHNWHGTGAVSSSKRLVAHVYVRVEELPHDLNSVAKAQQERSYTLGLEVGGGGHYAWSAPMLAQGDELLWKGCPPRWIDQPHPVPTSSSFLGQLPVSFSERALDPALARHAALAGAVGVLHLLLPSPGKTGAEHLDRLQAGERHELTQLQPLDECVSIPCVWLDGRDARRCFEWLSRVGSSPLSPLVRVGPQW